MQNEIQYENNIVCFLDVLGFKEMVYSKDEYDKKRLKNYHELANFILEQTTKIEPKKTIKYLLISDSIILSMPIEALEREYEKLRNFFLAICLVQFHLAKNQILTRGAVSYGGVIFEPDKNLLFGPGYIEAFLLETKFAKYPRVIVDMKVAREFRFETPQQFIEKVNKKDEGGISYDNWNSNILFDWKVDPEALNGFQKDYPLFLDWAGNRFNNCHSEIDFGHKVEIDNLMICIKRHSLKRNDAFDKIRWLIDYFKVKIEDAILSNRCETRGEALYLMALKDSLDSI